MRVAIVGSRDFPDLELVREYVASLPADAVVISGGARGVDQAAEDAARERGLSVLVFRPDYERYKSLAPLYRNHDIVREADIIVAFWDGTSRGTAHAIRIAREAGKDIEIRRPRVFPRSSPAAHTHPRPRGQDCS